MITDDKKEEIRATADIVEIVGDYVKLKKSGSGFIGLCPFHQEKTPSFHVTPRLGIYKCFGCGESGDVFSFVMQMEGISFPESLKTLADRYGIDLPDEHVEGEDERTRKREGIFHALKFAGLFFHRQLLELEDATPARNYLEKRGYDKKIWRSFGLGYAPSNSALLKAARNEGIGEEYLLEADLIKVSNQKDDYFDTFRNRLIFPIFNPSGKVIAFAGRILNEISKTAKYINSAQTPVYNKSEVVYGVNFAKNDIRKEQEVILVEGYTDVITLNQLGIKNVVASSGTSLTSGQIKVLQRYGNRIVMIYDADTAGQAAMERGMDIALEQGMEVQLMELPDGEDPDSFLKKYGKESFLAYKKEHSEDFVTFSIHKAEKGGKMDSPADRSSCIKKILDSIANIPGELDRQFYVQHLHQKTQIYRKGSDRELFQQLDVILNERKKQDRFRYRSSDPISEFNVKAPDTSGTIQQGDTVVPLQKRVTSQKRAHYELEIIRLLLQYGDNMRRFIGHNIGEDHFDDEEIRMFYKDVMKRHIEGEEITVEHYMGRAHPFPSLLGDILLERYTVSEKLAKRTGGTFKKDRNPVLTAKSTMRHLRYEFLKRKRIEITEQMNTLDSIKKSRLSGIQQKLQKEISRIEKISPDDLFEDPEFMKGDTASSTKKFEYKMKHEK
ncbi:MAG: DNA primase [Balneolaceae bacterium]|nr:MAG: DNA primase [Balneolaceae bacterium]